MKVCFKCHIEKEVSEFYRHPQMADGLLSKCKECTKKDVREYAEKNAKKVRAYMARRESNPRRKAKRIEYQRKSRELNPAKYKARLWVNNALRHGKLKRLPCEKCGNKKSEAHHEDYSKPKEIKWLCFRHHREAHGQTTHV